MLEEHLKFSMNLKYYNVREIEKDSESRSYLCCVRYYHSMRTVNDSRPST